MKNLFSLAGKIAIITGGAQGIGQAFAEALGEAGAIVIILDINEEKGNKAVLELNKLKIAAFFKYLDVTKKDQIENTIDHIVKEHGCIDIVINNVGIGGNTSAEETREEEWRNILDTNLTAMFLFAQAVGKVMLAQKEGVIINTASMSSVIIPHPQKQAAYNTSKAGVVQLTKSLASEWGSQGVRVNCISPGIVGTPLINTEALKSLKSEWILQNPMKRLATVEDLKGSIVYLASQASAYVNGHNLVVDGGHTLW